jgi:hypothetical protein
VLDWRRIRRGLLLAVAIVATLGLIVELVPSDALTPMLSLSYEENVPTWVSSSLLLACAAAAGAVALRASAWRKHWWFICGLATYMSLDEASELHEHLGGHLATSGLLYFDWVIPGALIVAALVAVYIPFIRALAPRTRMRLVIAGCIYVGGALVMELPLGAWTDAHGPATLGYALIDWVEETMEMVGATLAFAALLAHREEAA